MDPQRREDVTGWDAREFSGGFAGLREHVDGGFSGAVTDGVGWLFLFNGRVIGVVDTELDAFSDASGTVYTAPHEALPVLFAMQERGGTQRARYYTNDTSLAEADRKLSQGGFTGYVELTENVLSGDYYVTYTAGESMAAAYVGNSRRLETGEKAFDLADDEVGIYTVYEVDLDVRELPHGSDGSPRADASGGSGDAEAVADVGDAESETEVADDLDGADHTDPSDDESSRTRGPAHAGTRDDPDPESAGDAVDASKAESGPVPTEPDDAAASTARATETAPTESSGTDPTARPAVRRRRTDERRTEPVETNGDTVDRPDEPDTTSEGSEASEERRRDEDVFSEEAQWREARSIPALDPSETGVRDRGAEAGSARDAGRRRDRRTAGDRPSARQGRRSDADGDGRSRSDPPEAGASTDDGSPEPRSTSATETRAAVSRSGGDDAVERIESLEAELATAEAERESLSDERDALREDRESLSRKRDELAAERDRLEAELEELHAEVERLRAELREAESDLPDADRDVSAAEARDGTNLFVRYESKGGATLEDAHDGAVGRDELRENLRIEHHTTFETEGVTVEGRPFEEFLRDGLEYGFTRWLVEELPFEIAETGNESALRDLNDVLPRVDRAEIGGSVSIVTRDGGEETREQQPFDLVLRDRMGSPLLVADLNDTRAPTNGATLESLVGNGERVADSNDDFAGAFAVTASFFQPEALKTASDAVGGGLFGRSKRKSFVKLSRKRGYHLCLVESRDGGFHLTVPDL